MWHKILTVFIVIFFISISCKRSFDSISIAPECNSQKNQINFLFKYGIALRNELDTYDCTFQKDLILDPSMRVNLILDKIEIDSIYNKMRNISFFSYPDTFAIHTESEDTVSLIMPSMKYYFHVKSDSIDKELYLDDSIIIENTEEDMLRSLNKYIIDIIKSKEAYKNLPEPRGAYL